MTALPAEVERELSAFEAGRRVLRDDPRATPLVGGLSNRAWRVTAGPVDWVVRVGAGRDATLAIDRRAERVAVDAAAAHGLAPRCVHAATDRGVLVLEYVAGTAWSRARARSAAGIARIGALLRALHAVPVPAALPAVDVQAAIARHLARPSGRSGPVSRSTLAEHAQAALRDYAPGGRVFCHHDVHHLNVVEGERLVLVDWEYAGAGDPAMDLAAYAAYHDLDGDARTRLLEAYGSGVDSAGLDRACRVFDGLQALWHDAAGTWDALAPASRDALVARLTGRRTAPMDSR